MEVRKEMRLFERIPYNIDVSLRIPERKEGKWKGYIYNISGSGMGVVTEENDFLPGTNLEVRPLLKKRGVTLVYRGKVIWTKRISKNSLKIGVEIVPFNLLRISYLLREIPSLQ